MEKNKMKKSNILTKRKESGKVRGELYKMLLKLNGKRNKVEITGFSQWEEGSLVTSE